MLESTGVYEAFGVDVVIGDEEDVVPVGKIEQRNSDGGKSEHKRGNEGICNS